jgi:hypothetical protein
MQADSRCTESCARTRAFKTERDGRGNSKGLGHGKALYHQTQPDLGLDITWLKTKEHQVFLNTNTMIEG